MTIENFSIGKLIAVDANTEKDIEIWKVPNGQSFLLSRVFIVFYDDPTYDLEVYLKRGTEQIAPHIGSYKGNNKWIRDFKNEVFPANSSIIAHVKNANATESRTFYILLIGILKYS